MVLLIRVQRPICFNEIQFRQNSLFLLFRRLLFLLLDCVKSGSHWREIKGWFWSVFQRIVEINDWEGIVVSRAIGLILDFILSMLSNDLIVRSRPFHYLICLLDLTRHVVIKIEFRSFLITWQDHWWLSIYESDRQILNRLPQPGHLNLANFDVILLPGRQIRVSPLRNNPLLARFIRAPPLSIEFPPRWRWL